MSITHITHSLQNCTIILHSVQANYRYKQYSTYEITPNNTVLPPNGRLQ